MPRAGRKKSRTGIYHIVLRGINRVNVTDPTSLARGTLSNGKFRLSDSGYLDIIRIENDECTYEERVIVNDKETRWRQRYDNFNRAYNQFNAAILDFDKLSILEKEGLIQRFEYTFELAWKTLKDYLESQGVYVNFPREVIKAAFHYALIQEGETWIDMLEKRNLLAHTYDEDRFNFAVKKIKEEYYIAISQVHNLLGEKR